CGGNGVVYAFEPLASEGNSTNNLTHRTPEQRTGTLAAAKAPSPRGEGWGEGKERVHSPSMERNLPTLKKVFQFDFDPAAPKTNIHKFNGNRREGPSNLYGMPVFLNGRLYVAGGGDLWWGKTEAWLKCIDATGTGDITGTGLVWYYPLEKHVMSTAAVQNGL